MSIIEIFESILQTILKSAVLLLYVGFIAGVMAGFIFLKIYDFVENKIAEITSSTIKKLKEKKLLK